MAVVESTIGERKAAEERVLRLERERRRIGAKATKLDVSLEVAASRAGSPDNGLGAALEGVLPTLPAAAAAAAAAASAGASRPPSPTGVAPSASFAGGSLASPLGTGGGGGGGRGGSRPVSASARLEGRGGVTRTKEFSFMVAAAGPPKESIMKRRSDEEVAARRAEEEAVLHYKFEAQPIPESTKLPLFGMLMSRQETRRKLKHEARFAELQSTTKPFHLLMQHEAELRARTAASRARTELLINRELSEGRRFRAIPVPDTTQNPDTAYSALLAREKERPMRVASNARALAAAASLPPRMALAVEADKRRRAERDSRVAAEATAERRLARFQANDMPDFGELHAEFAESVREGRKAMALTNVVPFDFDSEVRKAAEAARKTALQREAELATSASLELRARSASARRGDGGGGGGGGMGDGTLMSTTMRSAFAPDGTRTRRASATGGGGGLTSRSAVSLSEKLSAPSAPPAAMTRAVQLRMLEVQRRLRERQERERVHALEEEARVARVRAATRVVAPIVARKEAERNEVPLAWQSGAITNAASLAKARFAAEARAREDEIRASISAAETARPMLFMRTSMEARATEGRHSAEAAAAKAVDASVLAFDDDDLALLHRRKARAAAGGGGGGGGGSGGGGGATAGGGAA